MGVRVERDDVVLRREGGVVELGKRYPGEYGLRKEGGAPETNRTSDLPLRRGLLYPLSYRGVAA